MSVSGPGGAYYRKVASQASKEACGIRASLTLPVFVEDPARQYVRKPDEAVGYTGPLDKANIYVGAAAGNRSCDVGLSWERIIDRHGRETFTDMKSGCDRGDLSHRFVVTVQGQERRIIDGNGRVVASGETDVETFFKAHDLRKNFAYLPFWRTINSKEGNKWHAPLPPDPNATYFYPGEKLVMRLVVSGKDTMRLDVRTDGERDHRHFMTRFTQEQMGRGLAQSFKRVASIDQFTIGQDERRHGVEGMSVVSTNAALQGMAWHTVSVLMGGNTTRSAKAVTKVPLAGHRAVDVRSRELAGVYHQIFSIREVADLSGEILDIRPLGQSG